MIDWPIPTLEIRSCLWIHENEVVHKESPDEASCGDEGFVPAFPQTLSH
jgi:hypothetical protein